MSIKGGARHYIPFFINATDLSAGTSQQLVAPMDGYLVGIRTIVQVAIVTGGDITVKADGDADGTTTLVAGLTATVADSAAVGSVAAKDLAPTPGDASQRVTAGCRIEVLAAAAFNGGGAVNGHLILDTFAPYNG